MDDAAEDERTIELSSIQAIFPELVIDPSDPYTATLDLPVTPLNPVRLHFSQPSVDATPIQLPTPPNSEDPSQDAKHPVDVVGRNEGSQVEAHELAHLPPLTLTLHLPENYPAEGAPQVRLSITPLWLSQAKLEVLTTDCTRLWQEMGRDQVVFSYIDHLQQQAETAFGLTNDEKPTLMRTDIQVALLDNDLKTKRKIFEQETFDCGICLEPKKGKDCHRLIACRHVFCTACLKDFYNSCITEGDVDSVKCLDPGCGKDICAGREPAKKRRRRDKTLNPSELLQIPIAEELVQRYVKLKRKKRIESDKNTIYCPRQWCQGAARSKKHPKRVGQIDDFSESDSEGEAEQHNSHKKKVKPEDIPVSKRLAVCEDCNFAFCIVCRKGWHGEMNKCNPRRQKELDAEELATKQYLDRYSTACPTCDAPSQKTMGCNHMICWKCKTHFCYLCSAYLMADNPYKHYNDYKSNCYMRLWELEGGDGEGAGHNFQGIGGVGGWEDEFEAEEAEEAGAPGEPAEIDMQQLAVEDANTDEEEEPAPDIRPRERAIEFVNFARGAQAQRIILPDEPAPVPVAPPAPVAPRPRGQRRRQARQRNVQGVIGHQQQQQPAPRPPRGPDPRLVQIAAAVEAIVAGEHVADEEDDEVAEHGVLPRAAPGQGREDGNQPAPARAMGLERFLE